MKASAVTPVVLVAAALAAIGMSVWTQIGQHEEQQRRARYEACVDGVVNDLIYTLTETRSVAAAERDTSRRLYADIAAHPASFQRRIGDYLAELERADEARARRPLPLPPSVTCGTP